MANSSNSSGIGIFGVFGVIFVCCKIFGIEPVVHWSWWWVTLPFWGGFVLMLGVLALIGLLSDRPQEEGRK